MHRTWLLLLAACKGGTPTGIQGTPELHVEPAELDFGRLPVGETSALTVTVSNVGGGTVNLLSAVISEGDRDVWDVEIEGASALGAGASADLVVTFTPENPGRLYGGVVHLRTDLAVEPGRFIPVRGNAGESEADDDGDGVTVAGGDCNDGDPNIRPGASERCNGIDDDCDGNVPADESDGDGDGVRVCQGDCADDDGARYPGNLEICDDVDNDCDGVAADHDDLDGDGLSICDGDCDDDSAAAAPGLLELCDDGLDNDCDGAPDSADLDQDGHDACGEAPDCDDAVATVFPRVVDTNGDDSAVGSRGAPLATLQQAIDSVAGCPIWLLDGDHDGATASVPVDIRGLYADARIEGPGRVLDLVGGSLENVTVADGDVDARGGGLRVLSGSMVLRDVAFENNAATDGGAVALIAGELLLFGDNRFEDNLASGAGGAIHVGNAGFLLDAGITAYVDNQANDGGAIHTAATATITGSTFRGNSAVEDGGAILISGGAGHLVQNNRIVLNDAGNGGGIAVSGTTGGTVRNNRLQDNTATAGGGVYLANAVVGVVNNTLTGNEANDGGAIRHLSGDADIHNNIAHFNTGNGAFHTDAVTIDGSYNTAFATAGEDWVGPWLTDGVGNRSENPGLFQFSDDDDPDNDVLILQPNSPSIDSGDPAPAFNDPDGTRNDRGHTGGPGAP